MQGTAARSGERQNDLNVQGGPDTRLARARDRIVSAINPYVFATSPQVFCVLTLSAVGFRSVLVGAVNDRDRVPNLLEELALQIKLWSGRNAQLCDHA